MVEGRWTSHVRLLAPPHAPSGPHSLSPLAGGFRLEPAALGLLTWSLNPLSVLSSFHRRGVPPGMPLAGATRSSIRCLGMSGDSVASAGSSICELPPPQSFDTGEAPSDPEAVLSFGADGEKPGSVAGHRSGCAQRQARGACCAAVFGIGASLRLRLPGDEPGQGAQG